MTDDFTDRRRHQRHTVNLPAVAVSRDGLLRLDARIVNVSESGARVEVEDATLLSEWFYLLLPQHRLQPCRLVWRDAAAAGIRYVET